MPGIAVSAAPCAALQPRAVPHSLLGRRLRPHLLPVSISTARMPPGVARSVDAEVDLLVVGGDAPLSAEPLPSLVLYCHTSAPLVGIERVGHARLLLHDDDVAGRSASSPAPATSRSRDRARASPGSSSRPGSPAGSRRPTHRSASADTPSGSCRCPCPCAMTASVVVRAGRSSRCRS